MTGAHLRNLAQQGIDYKLQIKAALGIPGFRGAGAQMGCASKVRHANMVTWPIEEVVY
jgi:hypothetical protein